MINTDTNTKVIFSGSVGAPELTLNRGDLVKLLKTVLVDGFNTRSATTVSRDSVDPNILIISLEVNSGFQVNQVVSVSGFVESGLNSEYRVIYTDNLKVKIKNNKDTSALSLAFQSTALTVKVAPLGFSLAYNDITAQGTACFKNKSETTPAILKVIDRLPPNGYLDTWNRYANIVAGQYLAGTTGDFLTGEKFPYTAASPDSEKIGNNVSGTSGIHGYLKWDYGLAQTTTSSYAESETRYYGTYPTDWRIIGDGNTFYLFIRAMGKGYSNYTICSFGLFSTTETENTNILLTGSSRYITAATSSLRSGGAWRSGFTKNHEYLGNFLFRNAVGKSQQGVTCTFFGLNHDSSSTNISWPSKGGINPINPSSGNLLSSEVYIKDSNSDFRGTLRGIQQLYGVNNLGTDVTLDEGGAIILTTRMYNGDSSDDTAIPYLFSLRDWPI